MNNKGFTLVELLVSISILAILTIIAIPTLRAFQNSNSNSQYENYAKSIETSAKLYNDSYSEDLFGNATDGCEKVSLTELMNKSLAKDISKKDINCNLEQKDSYVIVRKFNDEYKYEGYLYCENSSNVKVYSNMDEYKNDCVNNNGIPDLVVENDKESDTDKKTKAKTVKLKLIDDYGFTANQEIEYAWTKSETPPTSNSAYTKYSFNNSYIKTNGKPVELLTKSITNKDQNPNDKYWLHVRPIKVQNIINNSLTTNKTFGPFRFDNTAPSCDDIKVTSNVSSGKAGKDLYFTFNYSSVEDLNSFIFKVSYDNGNKWESTVINSKTTKFNIEKDGKVKYQITNIKDFAGNVTVSCPTKGTFTRDTKKPTCTITPKGTLGNNSWYTSKVTLDLSTSDSTSGVSAYGMNTNSKVSYNKTKSLSQTIDTTGSTFYAKAIDVAGNEASCDKTVKVELTNPQVSLTNTGTIGWNQIKVATGGKAVYVYVADYKIIPSVTAYSGLDTIKYDCDNEKNEGTGPTTSNLVTEKQNSDNSYSIAPNITNKDLFNIESICTATVKTKAGRTAKSKAIKNIIGNGWQTLGTDNHYGQPRDYLKDYIYWQNGKKITGFHDLWWFNPAFETEIANNGVYDTYYFYTGKETNAKNWCHGEKYYVSLGWCKNLDSAHPGSYLFTHYSSLAMIAKRWQPLNSMIKDQTIPVSLDWYSDDTVDVTFDKNGKCTRNCPSYCDNTGLKCS